MSKKLLVVLLLAAGSSVYASDNEKKPAEESAAVVGDAPAPAAPAAPAMGDVSADAGKKDETPAAPNRFARLKGWTGDKWHRSSDAVKKGVTTAWKPTERKLITWPLRSVYAVAAGFGIYQVVNKVTKVVKTRRAAKQDKELA